MTMQRADRFVDRHIGSGPEEIQEMLRVVGFPTLDAMIDAAVPSNGRPSPSSGSHATDEPPTCS